MRKFFIISMLLFLNQFLLSQCRYPKFDQIITTDGLLSSHISHITQDHLGFVWISTNFGLVKYDGYEFHPIGNNQSNQLLGNSYILKTLEDNYGNIWISAYNRGLFKLSAETGKLELFASQNMDASLLTSNVITELFLDDDHLWIGTDNGLIRMNILTSEKSVFQSDSLNSNTIWHNSIKAIVNDEEGNLWIGTENGLNKFNKISGTFTRYFNEAGKNSISSNQITSLYNDKKGFLWIGTESHGLNKLNLSTGEIKLFWECTPEQHGGLSDRRVTSILGSCDGIIYIGTFGGGLNTLDPETDQIESYHPNGNVSYGINSELINCLFEDNTGIIWIGTYADGINIIDKYNYKFNHITRIPYYSNSISSNKISSIYRDSKNNLWIGTNGSGLNVFDISTGKFSNYNYGPLNTNSLHSTWVSAIFEDRAGILWIGTPGGGLYKFDHGKKEFINYNPDAPLKKDRHTNVINDILEDSFGNLWITTQSEGLNRFDRETGKFHRQDIKPGNSDEMYNRPIFSIKEDKNGYLWMGTTIGLIKFGVKTKSFTHYPMNSLSRNVIDYVFIDSRNRIWISCYKKGLFCYKPESNKFIPFKNKQSRHPKLVSGILEDSNGFLWIGTDQGISKLDPETGAFIEYTQNDGLLRGAINYKSVFKDKYGEMYFGSNNGVNYFSPDRIINNQTPPTVIFTQLKISNEPVSYNVKVSPLSKDISFTKKIELNHWQNDLSLKFSAMQFSRPQNNQYAYKLNNQMEDWRYIGHNHLVEFENLNPGKYTLLVKAANSDGVWNENSTSLEIHVHPPFWATWYFRAIIIILTILMIYLLYKQKIKTIENRKKQLELRVEEKTKATEELNTALNKIEELKDRLEAENTYLKDEINLEHNFSDMISRSAALKKVFSKIEQVASTDTSVLILGESGTGKELIARAIHDLSNRSNRPLVKVNCAALPANLIESELFGHVKGAFTGAIANKSGKFELADNGTLFLDEIGELPLELQSKLLRILQEKEFEKVGGHKTTKINVRVIAATNRNLSEEIKNGKFREDLFFRLNVFPILLPPLRERKEDIPLLVNHFVKKFSAKIGKNIEKIPNAILKDLSEYHWPGNIRELENVIERAVIVSPNHKLVIDEQFTKNISVLKNSIGNTFINSLQENEKIHILKALELTDWRVSGDKGAAKILDIKAPTLISRMKKLGIKSGS